MRNKKERDEIFNHIEPYLDNEETIEDLVKICKKCNCNSHICENCRGCCAMELWLSNEYGECFGEKGSYW